MSNTIEETDDSKLKALFAAAFVHACDDDGTYFLLGEEFYNLAKAHVTDEAIKELQRRWDE